MRESRCCPLQTANSQGQPYVAISSLQVRPGQSWDAEAYVFNSANGPVQITGVAAVPVTEYEYRGHGHATIAWDGDAVCVYGGRNRDADDASCTAFGNKVSAIVEDMSGLS